MKVTKETKDAILTMFYTQYRMNLLTRDHLRKAFEVMREPLPDDIEGFFIDEIKKGQPIRRGR